MSRILLVRVAFDFVAVGLFVTALAYWWLDNLAHEIIGFCLFALLMLHNVFNRRWYGAIPKTELRPRTLATLVLNLVLLATMLVLIVTSVMISRSVLGFPIFNGTAAARQIHILAAYWALIIVAIHLGMHWSMIMALVRAWFGITTENLFGKVALRTIALGLAAVGVYSSSVIGLGSKLLARVTMDFWDFNESTIGFFAHHGLIVALWAVGAHYAMALLQHMNSLSSRGDVDSSG
jgi:hypothetical protein